jgi:transposase
MMPQLEFGKILRQFFYKDKMLGIKITKISERNMSKTCVLCSKKEHEKV